MRAHKRPTFRYKLAKDQELNRLRAHLKQPDRVIPKRTKQNVLIATWNVTNLGLQKRKPEHLDLMAEILKPFDVIAVQEIADDLKQFEQLVAAMGKSYKALYTDPAGNDERLAYIYHSRRVQPQGLAAELAMRGYERARIEVQGVVEEGGFTGFNRNPYMVTFRAGAFEFTLVNVHLHWSNVGLRQLETAALGKWAKSRVSGKSPPHNDIILVGDFNMPHVAEGDILYDIATQYGVAFPKHTTDLVGTNLAGDWDYDQVAFFPSRTEEDFTGRMGVVDFDNALFCDLFEKDKKQFFQYVRYYIADHRPLWAEFSR
jgi:endonuclease/exonuclease/phosphatase family metal-dependent hydrolase